MPAWTNIHNHISATLGRNFNSLEQTAVGGGCINSAWRIKNEYSSFFVKLNTSNRITMFEAEFEGLQALLNSKTVRAPAPICVGASGDQAYLVTEYLPLHGRINYAQLGENLAALHGFHAKSFGWHRENTLGTTRQINTPSNNWPAFWREQRLGFQLRLATKNGYTGMLQTLGETLLLKCHRFFDSYQPAASLLHGDLWSGNAAALADGTPVIFDPAVYYGDRETDIAMTELFGGFSPAFYAAYNACSPLDAGYSVRKKFYNLYHILNHLNLFGGGYRQQAEQTIEYLLAELG
jgi:fructosamine-3-kinase